MNVGSALTPIGNPQNLFLGSSSHTSFLHFLTGMAPLCLGVGKPVAPLDGRRLSPHADYGTFAGHAATRK